MSDIVIVGAGVIGASIAYHLAAEGCASVTVIDRAPSSGEGSTLKATGGFRAQFSTEINVRLSLLSRTKLRNFADEIGCDSGYRPCGYLFLARSESEMEALRAAHQVQQRCGLSEAHLVDAAGALALNPGIEDDTIIGGAFCPTDGFIRAKQILDGYIAAARRLGVQFLFGRDHREFLHAPCVINAAGAWAADIAPVAVTPLRRNVVPTVATDALAESMPMTIWLGDGFHLRVRDGRVLLLMPGDHSSWIDDVTRIAHERVPVLRQVGVDVSQRWSGFYEMSPDRHAIIGRHPAIENMILANGSSGHGVMHAPAIGQLVAELVVDGKATTLDITSLRPSRFAEGELIAGNVLL